ncbi:longitudinals lacking protein, isoforms A/B/D/L isoform X2 [Megalopta genalis]|uniref:longitudinals lacking protein, isoforms A/B/D/L isoform X2 n=1 Tax=Megalopta genalis TaxID=115081 RepID=UPI001442FA9C|nr:zinc finger protein 22-like [Megalopta genalis]
MESYELSSTLSSSLSASLKKHVCGCGKIYSQKSSLDRHLRYECGKMPNVPCPQCGKMFKHKHHVTQHLKSCRLKDPRNPDYASC